MTKDDLQRFFADLLLIDNDITLSEMITTLYNASYETGGRDLQDHVFRIVETCLTDAESILNRQYQDACWFYGVGDLGDEFIPRLTENDKCDLLGRSAHLIVKRITPASIYNATQRLQKQLLKLRKEEEYAVLYEKMNDLKVLKNTPDQQILNIYRPDIESLEGDYKGQHKELIDLFYNPADEIVCVNALHRIRQEKPIISAEGGRWIGGRGSKGVLSAWIYRMEDVGKIRTIVPKKDLVPLLEKRFSGLSLGECGRTLSGPDLNIVAEFTKLNLP